MIVSAFPLAEAAVADAARPANVRKAPIKRQSTVKADRTLAPEPR